MIGVQLLLSDSRGVYIPRDFVECFDLNQWNIDSKYIERLSNPDGDFYWDNWDVVLNNAKHTDKNGNKWHLWQDGDLWAICPELMTEEEKSNFGFED
jgi:hypothetical protein